MIRLNESAKSKKRSAVSRCDASQPVLAMLELLETLEKWVSDIPPLKQPSRFGNQAFRTWHARLVEEGKRLMSKVTNARNIDYAKEHNLTIDQISEELAAYLKSSFGDETRIDYGTGHEAHFLLLLFCLDRIGIYQEQDDEQLVLLIFPSYLRVTRLLQTTYMLEPAGSHGVWGLDDYSFLPFLWGSAQLLSSSRISPSIVTDDAGIAEHRAEYLYIDAIAFIKEVKRGPFHEHSSVLYGISGVQGGWTKINGGMIKMYKAEVWGKRPVIQHVLFGTVFPFPNAL